jgi:hypothetical protein
LQLPLLQQRSKDNWSPNFNVTFSAPSNLNNSVKIRREVVISIREKRESGKHASETNPEAENYLNEIRRDFQSKSSLQLTSSHVRLFRIHSLRHHQRLHLLQLTSSHVLAFHIQYLRRHHRRPGIRSYFLNNDSGKTTPASSITSTSSGLAVVIDDTQARCVQFPDLPALSLTVQITSDSDQESAIYSDIEEEDCLF